MGGQDDPMTHDRGLDDRGPDGADGPDGGDVPEPVDPADHMVHHHRDVQGGAARAAVFGVSDGLVSNVALILGVAAAASEGSVVLVAGVSGLLAGAASMAAGEYVSVRAQWELIQRELAVERASLADRPRLEIEELAAIYVSRGIDPEQATAMADAVMADPEVALEVHAREELGVDPGVGGGNPLVAAGSSFVAFALGAALPLAPWFVAAGSGATIASVVVGLVATATVGAVLAHFTERSLLRTAGRQMALATAACALTWVIGSVLGATVV
jgi:VIT1/CCC1 family predicted Fe2+/Mn2+ transporter